MRKIGNKRECSYKIPLPEKVKLGLFFHFGSKREFSYKIPLSEKVKLGSFFFISKQIDLNLLPL